MNRAIGVFGLICLVGALLAAPNYLGDYPTEVLFRLLIGVILAEAWNVLAGETGLVSLGTSSAVGLGAYVMIGLLNFTAVPIGVAIVLAAVAGALLAILAAPGLMRLRGLYFTVGTLSLAEALRLVMINGERFGGATGLFLNRDSPRMATLVRIAVALLAGAWAALMVARRSRIWVTLRAVRDDEDVAAQMGVRSFRVKIAVFAATSAVMAAAGAVQALKLGAVEPYGMFGLGWSVNTLAMAVIGGLGEPLGAVIGAAVVIVSGEWLSDYPQAHLALTGVLLIVVTRFAPRGIAGLSGILWAKLRAHRRPLS